MQSLPHDVNGVLNGAGVAGVADLLWAASLAGPRSMRALFSRVRDSSVLATPLAASLGRLRQQGLLKDGSVTAVGMPLLCPQRTGHGSHQHYSYTGPGSMLPSGSLKLAVDQRDSFPTWLQKLPWIVYSKCPEEYLNLSLLLYIFVGFINKPLIKNYSHSQAQKGKCLVFNYSSCVL